MAIEGEFPKSDGDILYASEANLLRSVFQLYEGTGFDNSTVTPISYELTAISSSLLTSVKYINLRFLLNTVAYRDEFSKTGATSYPTMLIEKRNGVGSYSTVMTTTNLQTTYASYDIDGSQTDELRTFNWLYELNATDISDGIQFKITTIANKAAGASQSSITNKQTVIFIL